MHFTVMVIGDNPEEKLAPYQENNMGDCPEEYLEFCDRTEEARERYENGFTKHWRTPDGQLRSYYEWNIRKLNNKELVITEFKEKYETFEDFVTDYYGFQYYEDQDGYGYWHNPNSRWDWYLLGGRWKGLLLVSDDAECYEGSKGINERDHEDYYPAPDGYQWCDAAKFGDIEWSMMEEIAKEEHDPDDPRFSTFAVVTKDGEWYSKGWGGDGDENSFKDEFHERFLKDLNDDDWIWIFDCHV